MSADTPLKAIPPTTQHRHQAEPASILIETKLHSPHSKPTQIDRPDLLYKLQTCEQKFVLISAPAGYGKSTLLAQWFTTAKHTQPCAWVTLDAIDRDPWRFWLYVVTALGRALPQLTGGASMSLNAGEPLDRAVLPRLVNELAGLGRRLILILDDYHLASCDAVDALLIFFINHLPVSVQVVIASRRDPLMLPLGLWRGRGELCELRQSDLRFTTAEALALLNNTLGFQLNAENIATLIERTEGWATGIYLAAHILRQKTGDSVNALIHGTHRHFAEYLIEEVLATLPIETQRFLQQIAILERFCGPLCDEVANTLNATDRLKELAHTNLLLIELDPHDQWFRFHHLLRELLLSQLRATEPDEKIAELHHRAAVWHRYHGTPGEAIDHATAGGDYALAAELINAFWLNYLNIGQIDTVHRQLQALPEAIIENDARLAITNAWLAAIRGERHRIKAMLTAAERDDYRGPLPDGTSSVAAAVAIIRGLFTYNGINSMMRWARRALELEPEHSPWRIYAWNGLAAGAFYTGNFELAKQAIDIAIDPESQPVVTLFMLSMHVMIAVEENSLDQAAFYLDRAQQLVEQSGLTAMRYAAIVNVARGAWLAATGHREASLTELEWAREQLDNADICDMLTILTLLAQVRHKLGEDKAVRSLLAEARDIMAQLPDTGRFPMLFEKLESQLDSEKQKHISTETASGKDDLTERELDVLQLLTDTHLSQREIGERLYISANTVKSHVRAIYRKLRTTTREEAAAIARRQGLY